MPQINSREAVENKHRTSSSRPFYSLLFQHFHFLCKAHRYSRNAALNFSNALIQMAFSLHSQLPPMSWEAFKKATAVWSELWPPALVSGICWESISSSLLPQPAWSSEREHRAVQPRPAPAYCAPEGDKWQDKDGVRKAYLVWGSKSSAFPK